MKLSNLLFLTLVFALAPTLVRSVVLVIFLVPVIAVVVVVLVLVLVG